MSSLTITGQSVGGVHILRSSEAQRLRVLRWSGYEVFKVGLLRVKYLWHDGHVDKAGAGQTEHTFIRIDEFTKQFEKHSLASWDTDI